MDVEMSLVRLLSEFEYEAVRLGGARDDVEEVLAEAARLARKVSISPLRKKSGKVYERAYLYYDSEEKLEQSARGTSRNRVQTTVRRNMKRIDITRREYVETLKKLTNKTKQPTHPFFFTQPNSTVTKMCCRAQHRYYLHAVPYLLPLVMRPKLSSVALIDSHLGLRVNMALIASMFSGTTIDSW